jgi:4-amino-4-deoxy-L-arabinose transferase-like glycosyltransferase
VTRLPRRVPGDGARRAAPVLALWLAVTAGAFVSRGLWAIDETRYAAVAWEMWLRHDWLVPRLNGAPYSDKPPLLFWLVQLGWAVGGVSEWWPRLVPMLAALLAAYLAARLAAALWPDRPETRRTASLILFGTPFWALYGTFLLHDMLLVCAVLLALLGLLRTVGTDVRAGDGRRPGRGWILFAAGLGVGALAKGPVVLLHTLPAGLLAPWWGAASPGIGVPGRGRWARWYAGLAGGVLLGGAIGLAWALPAAAAGGPAYGDAILWGQTAGRVVHAVAHPRPWWWYLPLLPVALFPWILWAPAWRALRRARQCGWDAGTRFCVVWAAGGFVLLSAVSGKQPHYLLPLLPAFALLTARAATAHGEATRRRDALAPLAILGILGLVLAALPRLGRLTDLLGPAFWLPRVSPVWGLGLIATICALAASSRRDAGGQMPQISFAGVALVVLFQLGFASKASPDYEVTPLANHLAALERRGVPVAHLGRYDGQYQFGGRLRSPLDAVEPSRLAGWLGSHPGGRVVVYYRDWRTDLGAAAGAARRPVRVAVGRGGSGAGSDPGVSSRAAQAPRRVPRPEFEEAYRGGAVAVWSAAALRAHPGVLDRIPSQTPDDQHRFRNPST